VADLRREGERGQILLIAAFTLAVTFVALALVVNSAIFTENLASRGEVAGSSEALTYQHQVRQGVAEAMAYANVYDDGSPGTSLAASVDAIRSQGTTQQARAGQLLDVSLVSTTDGTRIADNASGGSQFLSAGGLQEWNLAKNVDRTRNLVVTTRYGDLPTSGTPFRLEANRTGTLTDIWTLSVWRDGSDNVVVDVDTADGDTAQCRVDVAGAGEFDIDVTGGVVAGERCHALTRDGTAGTPMWFATGIPSGSTYRIDVANGHAIAGNYSMVVAPRASWNSTTLTNGETSGPPFRTDALYGATVAYVYRTSQVTYETEIEVRPGEAP